MTGPSYLSLNRFNIFYFRHRTPQDIAELLPSIRKEVKLSLKTKDKRKALRKSREIKLWLDEFIAHIREFKTSMGITAEKEDKEYEDIYGKVIYKIDVERAAQAIEDQRFVQQFSVLFEKKDRLKSFFQRQDVWFDSISDVDLSSINKINKFMAVVDLLHANPEKPAGPYIVNLSSTAQRVTKVDDYGEDGVVKSIKIGRIQLKKDPKPLDLNDPTIVKKRGIAERKILREAFSKALDEDISAKKARLNTGFQSNEDKTANDEEVIFDDVVLDTEEDAVNLYKLISLLKSGQQISIQQLEGISSKTTVVSKNVLKISELFDRFYRERSKEWSSQKTHTTNKAIYRLCIEIIGDIYTDQLDFSHANLVCDTLQRLPANRNRKAEYRDLSIEQLTALQDKFEPMTAQNVNKYMSRLSEAFTWAYQRKYVSENVFKGIRIKDKNQKRKQSELRDRFTADELVTIFTDNTYKGTPKRTFYYWLPLLGLYTGARLQELCQLRLSDIYQRGKVWCIDINDDNENGEQKQLKTVNARRKIPIHKDLIKVGFINYYRHIKELYEARDLNCDLLFPDLIRGRDGWGHNPAKWFSRHLQTIGVKQKGKSYHSFRHTFADELKQSLAPKYIIDELLGHALESLSLEEYGKPYALETKQKILNSYAPLPQNTVNSIGRFMFWSEFKPMKSIKTYNNINKTLSVQSDKNLCKALSGRLQALTEYSDSN